MAKVNITFRLPLDCIEKIRNICQEENRSVTSFILDCIETEIGTYTDNKIEVMGERFFPIHLAKLEIRQIVGKLVNNFIPYDDLLKIECRSDGHGLGVEFLFSNYIKKEMIRICFMTDMQ